MHVLETLSLMKLLELEQKINNELGTVLIENFAHGNATCSDWYREMLQKQLKALNVQYKNDNPNETALYMNTNVLSNQS